MKKIESISNPLFKKWLLTLNNGGLKKSELSLVCSKKLVSEFADKSQCKSLVYTDEETLLQCARELEIDDKKCVLVSKQIYSKVDLQKTQTPLMFVTKPQIEPYKPNSFENGILVFAGLSDPGNLGALMRSAEAFSASGIVLLEESCNPFSVKVLRASSGANYRLPLYRGPSLYQLPEKNLIALDMKGEDIKNFNFPPCTKLLVGEEGQGLQNFNGLASKISIPINTQTESLNATVASSIVLFMAHQSVIRN